MSRNTEDEKNWAKGRLGVGGLGGEDLIFLNTLFCQVKNLEILGSKTQNKLMIYYAHTSFF
jgi:hypothetical protein